MFQIKAKILYNKRVKGNYWHCALEASQIAQQASPGQFVHLKISETVAPLLRRPFSIHRLNGGNIEILYAVVGRGTEILTQKKATEYLDVIGPLGNGFNLTPNTSELTSILVAGGMGVAPLLFLIERLMNREPRTENREPFVLIGAKTKSQILCEKEFKNLGCEVKIATDDGSRGFKGKVTELLKEVLLTNSRTHELTNSIYACGPKPMLEEIAVISKKYNLPAQVSLEEHMACGIGACFGCVVNTKKGYQRVCKEGPVFDAQEIIW